MMVDVKTFRVAGKEDDDLSFGLEGLERFVVVQTGVEDDSFKFFRTVEGEEEVELTEDEFTTEIMHYIVLREMNEYNYKPNMTMKLQ